VWQSTDEKYHLKKNDEDNCLWKKFTWGEHPIVTRSRLCKKMRSKMNTLNQSKAMAQTSVITVIVIALMLGLTPAVHSDETKSDAMPAQTNAVEPKAGSTNSVKIVAKYQLTGAELYSINCNRCHQERYPTERTGAQWKTIMLHMQVRANLPVKQAKLILQYLQENSGR
jgi:mono/diheme cytochrome c family protein